MTDKSVLESAYRVEESKLEEESYSAGPKFGNAAWLDFVSAIPNANVNLSIGHGSVTRETGTALFARDENGDPVAAIGARLFDNLKIWELRAGRMWLSEAEAVEQKLKCLLPFEPPWTSLSRRIVQTGGLHVLDAHRGKKIGHHLDMMIRLAIAPSVGPGCGTIHRHAPRRSDGYAQRILQRRTVSVGMESHTHVQQDHGYLHASRTSERAFRRPLKGPFCKSLRRIFGNMYAAIIAK